MCVYCNLHTSPIKKIAMSGWIKLHRDLIKWEWYETPNMVQFFVHCLLRANHSPKRWQGVDIEAGQFVSGRMKLSQETGLSQQSVRTCIERLKSTNELTIKSTSKYSIFTLNNWEKYQSGETATSNLTNEQPASNQQVTTNKNEKNVKNEKKYIEVVNYLNQVVGSNYKATTSKTQSLIESRFKEGFTFENFKTVIFKKSAEWKGTEQEKYLRPETLFGPKFEGYLNQQGNFNKNVPSYMREQDELIDQVLNGGNNAGMASGEIQPNQRRIS